MAQAVVKASKRGPMGGGEPETPQRGREKDTLSEVSDCKGDPCQALGPWKRPWVRPTHPKDSILFLLVDCYPHARKRSWQTDFGLGTVVPNHPTLCRALLRKTPER